MRKEEQGEGQSRGQSEGRVEQCYDSIISDISGRGRERYRAALKYHIASLTVVVFQDDIRTK
jgi:hypothetical protein